MKRAGKGRERVKKQEEEQKTGMREEKGGKWRLMGEKGKQVRGEEGRDVQ